MKQTLKRTGARALIAMMAIMVITGAGAALTFDNETTVTSSTSDLTGGETVTDLDSETTKTIEVEATGATSSSDSENFTLRVINNNTDRVVYEDTSTSWTATSQADGYWKASFTHAEMFSQLERSTGEDVPVTVEVVYNEGLASEDGSTIDITARNDDAKAVDVVTADDRNATDDIEVVEQDGWVFNENYAKISGEENVNGTNTDIVVVLADENISDKATAGYDAESTATGDEVPWMAALTDDTYVSVFDGTSDSNDTHVTYEENPTYGEHSQMTISTGDEYSDAASASYEIYAGNEMSFIDQFNAFGLMNAISDAL